MRGKKDHRQINPTEENPLTRLCLYEELQDNILRQFIIPKSQVDIEYCIIAYNWRAFSFDANRYNNMRVTRCLHNFLIYTAIDIRRA